MSLKDSKLKLLDRLFSIDDNRECIAMFFKFLNNEILKQQKEEGQNKEGEGQVQENGHHRHGYHGVTLFCIENDINYLLTSNGCQYIVTQLIEQLTSPPHCVVIMDSYIMTKLARGLLKPMSAILGGQLKIEGDIKVFGELTPLLRASVKAMMEHNKTNFNLDVSILRTYVKSDDGNNRHTEYVIRSIDRIGGNYWETPHRFSDFIQFRKVLKDSGFQNLPDLPRKHLIHSSVHPTVVRRRMEDLALFLQLIIIQIGSSDPHVVNFLGAYLSGTTQTISQLTIPSSLKKSGDTNHDNSSTGENEDEMGDGDDDDNESFHNGLSSVDDALKMKHALKVAQEHAEFYVHETHRKPSIVSSSFYSASFSLENHSKSVDKTSTAGVGYPVNLASTLTYSSPSPSTANNSRTNTVRDEIFQLKRRIDTLESQAGDGKSLSSYLASSCLHFIPRVTLWGTIFSLVLGFALPLLLSSSNRISVSFSHLREDFTLIAIAYILSSSMLSILTYLFSFVMITFIISMPYSRLAATVSIVLYLLSPLLSPSLSLLFQIINNLLQADLPVHHSSPQLCGIGVYLPDQDLCSYSPTRIILTSSCFILLQIIRRNGFIELLLSWLISIPINYSLHTMKNFGVKVFPSHPLTSLLKYIMIIERLFTIYTPIATVVSAYIYLTIFLKLFGYAAPSLISGTTNSSSQTSTFPDKKQRQFNDSNRNLTSSAYHALDRVLAEYVLNEICSLQSIFIKLGQYVAGRPDLVSSLWSDILSKLHDSCPVSSSLYIKTIVETCLTATKTRDEKLCSHSSDSSKPKLYYQKKKLRSLDELFESFEMKPIVSGCIAQYHQATMIIDGQLYEVVVKVQHPTIETLFEIDMSALTTIVTIATKFYSKWKVSYSLSLLCLSPHVLPLSSFSLLCYLSLSASLGCNQSVGDFFE
jgi:hypothetical protein